MRNVRPGSIQSAIREAFTAAGGLESVSSDLAVSVTNLSRATSCDEDRPGGLGVNHLDRLGRIIPESAVPIARHFAHMAGGIYQPANIAGLLGADMSKLVAEFSDVLAVHAEAMSGRSTNPNDYTMTEARAALKEVDDLLAATAVIRAALVQKAGGR